MKRTNILAAALTAVFVITAAGVTGAAAVTVVTAVSIVTASPAQAERRTWKQKQAKRKALLKKWQKLAKNRARYAARGIDRLVDPSLLNALDQSIVLPAPAATPAVSAQYRTSWTSKVTGPGILPFGGADSSELVTAPDYVPPTAIVTSVAWTTQVFYAPGARRYLQVNNVNYGPIAASGRASLPVRTSAKTAEFGFYFNVGYFRQRSGVPIPGANHHAITVNYRI